MNPEMLKNAKKLDKESLQLPKGLLDKVSGGTDVTAYESEFNCPYCGAPGLILYYYGIWLIKEYCQHCGRLYSYDEERDDW